MGERRQLQASSQIAPCRFTFHMQIGFGKLQIQISASDSDFSFTFRFRFQLQMRIQFSDGHLFVRICMSCSAFNLTFQKQVALHYSDFSLKLWLIVRPFILPSTANVIVRSIHLSRRSSAATWLYSSCSCSASGRCFGQAPSMQVPQHTHHSV